MKKNLSVAAIGSVIMIFVLRWQGSSLQTPVSKSIIDLEFANTQERLHELLAHWDISVVKMNIWLDFLFIVTYTLFLSIAAELCARKWPSNGMPAKTGLLLARLAYVAGMFDIAGNLLMLQTIAGHYTNASLELTFYCASIRFLFAGLIILYCIISLPVVIRKK